MRKSQFSKALTIALPPENYEQIRQITDEQEISLAEWVRAAIDNTLAKHQRKEDLCNEQ